MPDTITDFGEFIFDGCTRLRHLQLPKELGVLWGYDMLLRKLIECIKVNSKTEITIIFKGGIEVIVPVEK